MNIYSVMNVPTMSVVHNKYEDSGTQLKNRTTRKVFTEFIREYLNKSHKNEGYKRIYNCAVNHINAFAKYLGQEIYTSSFSEETLEEFVFFLQEQQNLMSSTVKGMIERTKAMLQRAYNAGYHVNMTFKDFIYRDEEISTVFLSMTEITRIYYYDLKKKNYDIARDYFVLGCLTALRYSDYSRLGPENFVDRNISIKTKKTKKPVVVPMHPFVREILQKYNNVLPKAFSIQYFNKTIKEVCREVGIVDLVAYERHKGLNMISIVKPKCDLISSHTARRSAATNMFLAGISTLRIMKITGHNSEQIFMKYIRVSNEENALTLSAHQFFN